MHKVILADDFPIMRDIFSSHLRACSFDVIGEASNGFEVLELLSQHTADVVITDIQMPEMDGIELTRQIAELYPGLPVIGLTMYEDDHLVSDMLKAGARGYLLKRSTSKEFKEAIDVVLANGHYMCRDSLEKLKNLLPVRPEPIPAPPELKKLTERELKIIRYTCAYLPNTEIGKKLFISPRTVDNSRAVIYKKLGIHKIQELIEFAKQHKIDKE